MTFGDPIIYTCPSCKKPMQMTTYNSYTVSRSESYSDGYSTGGPHLTPDLAKCPRCKTLFFRHNVKGTKKMEYREARKSKNKIKDIKDPKRADLIKALKKKLAKNRKEEKQIREYLWRDLNREIRSGKLNADELKLWKKNCAALLSLTEKALEKMQSEKNDKKHDDKDRDNCRVQIAELNRNLGKFDECMNAINQLNEEWHWIKVQFEWECTAKNYRTFELIGKRYMNLETTEMPPHYNPAQGLGNDYFERGKIFNKRGYVEKALADFNRAEELGLRDYEYYNMLIERGGLYLKKIKDYDKAIADFTKSIPLSEYNRQKEEALIGRGEAYSAKDDFAAALADVQAAIEINDANHTLYNIRHHIHKLMGNAGAAEWDNIKTNLVWNYNLNGRHDDALSFCETDHHFKIIRNTKHAKDCALFTLHISQRDGGPVEPEILYSGGENALFRRRPGQFMLLNGIHGDDRQSLLEEGEILIIEHNDKKSVTEAGTPPPRSRKSPNPQSQSPVPVREYMIKVRTVLEPLDTVKETAEDGYPFFTSLRARLYANKDKPIREIIGKEDWTTLACILVREEDYAQLERYAAEKLPLNEISPKYFRPFQPTPIHYLSMYLIWDLLKDPEEMLRWLINHGADINKAIGDKMTPLGNQCFSNGKYGIMKALLDAGADPNLEVYLGDVNYAPLTIVSYIADYDLNTPPNKDKKKTEAEFTPEQVANCKKLAELLREYGAELSLEEEQDDDGRYDAWA